MSLGARAAIFGKSRKKFILLQLSYLLHFLSESLTLIFSTWYWFAVFALTFGSPASPQSVDLLPHLLRGLATPRSLELGARSRFALPLGKVSSL